MFLLTGGQFLYSNGSPIAGGTLTLTLSAGATILATGGAAPSSYTFSLDSNGVIVGIASVWGNAELSPAGTYYIAVVKIGATTVWGPMTWLVGPSSIYAGNLFPDVTVLPPIVVTGGALLSSNNTWTGKNIFSGGFIDNSIINITNNYTVDGVHSTVLASLSAPKTVSLPAAGTYPGYEVLIKNVGASPPLLSIATAGSDTIDGVNGASAYLLSDPYQYVKIKDCSAVGLSWQITGNN